jgi:enoyl-CoA hydratase/carnithine racemase
VTEPVLVVDVAEGVARVTLNRPEVRNALDEALLGELDRALRRLEDDPAARVIVLRGAGDRRSAPGPISSGSATGARPSRRASPSADWPGSSSTWPGCERP